MTFGRKLRRQIERRRKEAAKRRNKVLFEPLEPRLLLDGSGLDPHPVLIVPGFGATLSAAETEAGLEEWFATRGIAPDKIQADPLTNTYDDLVQTLENVGYTENQDLFMANWDWRVPVAPNDGSPDGVISGVTADLITDEVLETGLDYLGYWLKKAQDAWAALYEGELPTEVDIIAHSTGGLIARSYIQSDAYGDQYDSDGDGTMDRTLPLIDDLVLVGVPNQGAGEIWNILHNDFNDSLAKRALAIIVDHAWDLVQGGTPIQGPDYEISEASDPQTFISQYIASAKDLLPTFDFLDSDLDGTFEPLSGDDANQLVLDLNFGLDENPDTDPNAFIDQLGGALTVVFGTADETITGVQQHTGPSGISLLPPVQHFDELLGHQPVEGETWYQEVKVLASGDSTVTRASAVGQFEGDARLGDTLFLSEMGAGHRALVSDMDSQKAILGAIGLVYGADYTDADISVTPQNETTAALMSFFNNPGDTLQELAGGLGDFFDSLQNGFNAIFDRLPIIGPAFIEGAQFFSDFAVQISSSLVSLIDPGAGNFIESIQKTIFDVFDGYVLDNNADELVNSDDILIGIVEDALEFGIHLGGEIAGTELDLGFDVGLDAVELELAMAGGLELSVQWDLNLGFGIVLDDLLHPDFFLDTSDGNEAELLVYAALTERTTLSGSLGFLQLTATDIVDEDDIDIAGDPNDVPNPYGRTGIFGSVGIDLRDPGYYDPEIPSGRLTIDQMQGMDLRKMVVGTVNTGADVNLHFVTNFDEEAVFPSISADLDIDWDFLSVDTSNGSDEGMFSGETPAIAFNDVTLDLGSFISNFVGPILEQIQQVLDPIMPFVDMLTMELPVITELADIVGYIPGLNVDPGADREPGVSIYDLAAAKGGSGGLTFVLTVIDFFKLLDGLATVSDAGGVSVQLGSFQLTGTDEQGNVQVNVDDYDAAAQLDLPGDGAGAKSFLKSAIASGLEFPILTEPYEAFKLLMGLDANLFYFDLPELYFSWELWPDFEFPIFPPFLEVGFEGNFTATADIDFGFDTYGIRQFKESKDCVDIFNGFYLDDLNDQQDDVPEIEFNASLVAKACVDAFLFEAGARGGIFGHIEFDLHDIDPDGDSPEYEADGKVRVDEMLQRLSIAPTAIFDIEGAVTYGLDAYIWVGIKIPLIFKTIKATIYQDSFDIASGTLVDFNVTYPDETPDLAHISNRELILHTGPNALRRGGEYDKVDSPLDVDGNEIFTVSFEEADADDPNEYIVVSAMGGVEKFKASDIDLIYAEGGLGDDRITIQSQVEKQVKIYGDFADGTGSGNDRLKAGGGNALLKGGAGDDELYGGAGDDELYGGAGDDAIRGGGGDDEIFGGGGHDRLRGDAGTDTLSAGSGLDIDGNVLLDDDGNEGLDLSDPDRVVFDDQLDGGGGDDTLYGAAGNDMLLGQSGSDQLYGGADDDTLRGGAESDELYGEAGEDLLEGGLGDDDIYGGDGSDTITWSAGDGGDTINGGNSGAEDLLHMTGTDGSDTVEINLSESSAEISFNEQVALNANGIEELGLDVGLGADTVTISELYSSINTGIALNLGAADGQTDDNSADTLTLSGTTGNDTYYLYTLMNQDTSEYDLFIEKPEGLALKVASGDAATGDTVIVKGGAGDDTIDAGGQLDPETRGGVQQETVLLRLEGDGDADTITTRYDNVAVSGGSGSDSLLVRDDEFRTDLARTLTLIATATDAGYLIVNREGMSGNIVNFEEIEDFKLDLAFDNDLWVQNTIAGQTTVTGGTGTDLVTVTGARGPLAVDGSDGTLALTIDRTTDTNGLIGNLSADTITGLGFVEPITYTGIDALTLDLGAGADDLTIDGTGAGTVFVNARGGGDEIIVKAINGPTFIYGGMAGDDPFGSGFQDTLTVEIGDTTTLTPDSYIDLSYTVDILRVKHLTAEPANWLVWDKYVCLDPDPSAADDEIQILPVEPEWIADHAVIEGNGLDTLAISDEVLEPQAVAIDGERVRIQHGVDLFQEESRGFISDPSQAFSTIVSPHGKYVYTIGTTDNGFELIDIYETDDTTGDLQLLKHKYEKKLTASDGAASDFFGDSVAISGDRAIIGAHFDDDNGSNSGSAYVFENVAGIWQEVKKLTASDGASGDYFGGSVAISGDTAIIGAFGDDDNGYDSGSVYVFEKDVDGIWQEVKKLTAPDGAADDFFGGYVAISGDTAIIGAHLDDDNGTNSGSVYVFEKNESGIWQEVKKLTAPDGAADDFFGSSVAISGDTAIIGARQDDDKGYDSGSAYVFEKNESGTWTQVKKLTASDGAAVDHFGSSVAISGDSAIIGAHLDDDNGTNSGSVYVFEKNESGIWEEKVPKLTAPDGAADDFFGSSVAISGDSAIIGAFGDDDNGFFSGSAYVFEKVAGFWTLDTKLTASGDASEDHFGYSVAISGERAIIGAYGDDDNGSRSGSAYVVTPHFVPGAESLTISPNGNHVYVASGSEDALTVFSRNSEDGNLTPVQGIKDSVNLQGADYIEISPDGTLAYAATEGGVAVFERDPVSGALSFTMMIGSAEIADGDTGTQTGLYYYDPDHVVSAFFPPPNSILSNVSSAGYYYSGAPNNIYHDLMLDWVTFDLGEYQLYDQPGGDFNVYEENKDTPLWERPLWEVIPVPEFSDMDVFVSENGVDFDDVTATRGPALNIPGQGSPDDFFAYSYDISGTGLTSVRYIKLQGVDIDFWEKTFGNRGFDLDTIGAFVVPALDYDYTEGEDIWKDVGGRPGVYDEGIDTKIFDGNDGFQIVDGAVGVQAGLYYFDQDSSGGYTIGDIIWKEVGDTQGVYDEGIDATIYQTALGVGRPETMASSPDGQFLYIASTENITICRKDNSVYSRIGTVPIANPSMLALSPDGKTLYAARKVDSAIDVLAVEEDGTLTFLQSVENDRNGVRGLGGVASLVVTGAYVVAAGETGDALVAFSRDEAGLLTYAQRLKNLYGGIQGLENPNSLAISPDGAYLYVGSSGEALSEGGLAWFGVNLVDPLPAPPLDVGFSGITSLTVETGDGDDTISVRDVAVPLTLQTNAGADSVVVHNLLDHTAEIDAEIDLGVGGDTLDLRDTGDDAVTNIYGGDNDDFIKVWHTGTSSQTTIEAGDGTDTIRVAGDALFGEVSIYGESPAATLPGDLLEFDSGGLTAYAYNESGIGVSLDTPSLPNGQIQTDGFQKVYYFDLEDVSLLETLPRAIAGGPYNLQEGGVLALDASNSEIPGGTVLSVEWDINGDGEFGEVSGWTPTVSWQQLQLFKLNDDGTYQVALSVTTDVGIDIDTADVVITNVPPTLNLSGGSAYEGRPYTLNLSSSDPGEDTITGWTIDWGDGSVDEIRGNPSSVTHIYTEPDDDIKVTGWAADEDGVYDAGNQLSIEVLEVAPPQIDGNTTTPEGSPYTLELVPGEHIIDRWFVDWGDESPTQAVAGTTGQLTHTFLNDSSPLIAVTALNQYGRVFYPSMQIAVENVPPTADAGGPYTILEGASLTLSGSGSDPAAADSAALTFTWDLNDDGTFGDATGPSPTMSWAALKALNMGDDGTYTGTLRVSDDDTWTDVTTDLTIENVAPTAALNGPEEIAEGSEFTLTIGNPADPGNDLVTEYIIDWGDGSTETVAAPLPDAGGFLGTSEISYVYVDGDDDYVISVQLFDGDGTWENDKALNLHVRNAAPVMVAESHTVTVNEAETAANSGNFSDPGAADTVSLAASVGTVTDNGNGTWSWSFDTSDGPDDSQRVTITATDSDGATTRTDFDLIVKNVAPEFEAGFMDDETLYPPVAGVFSRTGITFIDPGDDKWIRTVNFGDNTGDQALEIENKAFDLGHIYTAEGTYNVAVTVRDDDGGSCTDSFQVEVLLNSPPVADAGGPYTVNEGAILTLDGSGSTDEEENIDTWEWDLDNDGQYDDAIGQMTTVTWPDDGLYPVGLKVTDSYGESSTDTLTVTVNNVAPVVEAGADQTVDEGEVVSVNAKFTDAGSADTHTATINWGDGTATEAGTVTESPFGPPGSTAGMNGTVDGSHVYADNGTYTVAVTVEDDDGGRTTDTLLVTVNNDAPELDAGADQTVDEGVTVSLDPATFNDLGTLDTHTATIDWGDGTAVDAGVVTESPFGPPGSALGADGTIAGSHVYADDGIYTVTVTVEDDDGGTTTDTLLVTVNNDAPELDAGADQTVDEGVTVSLDPATFNDLGTLDTHTATIDWGDGTAVDAGVVTESPFGPPGSALGADGTIAGSHVYADNGIYSVTVTVEDDDGGTTTDILLVTVLNVAPTLDAGADQTVDEGSVVTLDPATFNDLGTLDTHTATIDWGDGTALDAGAITEAPFGPPGSTAGMNGTIAGSHVYADNGIYTVTVTVEDDDGSTTTDILLVTVLNVAPTLDAGADQTVDEGSVVTLDPATFNDLGTLDTHTATIDWGDGTALDAGAITEAPFGPPGSTLGADGTVDGSHVYADDGIYTVTLTVTDDDGGAGTDTFEVTVSNVAPTITFGPTSQTVQYSDPIETITIAATDVVADTMNALESWSTDGVNFTPGLPDAMTIDEGLEFSGAANQAGTGTWTLSGIADLEPGTYVIRVTVTDDDGGEGSADATIIVDPEDAVTTYVGPMLVSTPSEDESTAIVELRAVIQDITFYPEDPDWDENAGDITRATVTFRNLDNLDPSSNIIAADVPVELIDPADPLTGAAVYEWSVDIGNQDSESFTIGIEVDGFYSSEAKTIVTVSKPLRDFITGGGYLINENSAGTYAGDPGLKTNFGFNVKFNKQLTNLQGKVNAIIRKDGRVYQIKTNATDSLVVDPINNTGTFISKANLTDVTDPLNPISISGNLTLIVTLTDNGEPGSSDSIAFTLWQKNELWFSSRWTGAQTVEQVLDGGNLMVRAGEALLAAEGAVDEQADGQVLTLENLEPIFDEAISRWGESDTDPALVKALKSVEFRIADLEGSTLGLAFGETIWIDVDAAGHGWFIDRTPYDDIEFSSWNIQNELIADPTSDAYGDMDLLTAVMHELGHVFGFEDLDPEANPDDLMAATLDESVRYLPGNKSTGQSHDNNTNPVAIDLTQDAEVANDSLAALVEENPWLIKYLLNGAEDDTNPNDDIAVVIPDEDPRDTSTSGE